MAYLDLSPMLQAMRVRPSEFEMQGVYLHHVPSHHLLNFDTSGIARVHARCDCAMLDVSREQSEEMRAAMSAWKVVYWEPRLAQIEAEKRATAINREFASHFRPPNAWRRFLAFLRPSSRIVLRFEERPDTGAAAPSELSGQSRTAERRELLPN